MSTIAATTSSTAATADSSNSALGALSSNFNDFLNLLTTQLQNQDPDSPVDTGQFTSELAQFAGVQQQVDTNTNLTSLIQLTQGNALLQGETLVGKQVELNSTALPLQNGAAALTFTAPSAEPVQVSVADGSGNVVASQTLNAVAGTNNWSWNGATADGSIEPDGTYSATVAAIGAGGVSSPLGFTTAGTVTGVVNSGGTIDVELGPTSIGLGDIASL